LAGRFLKEARPAIHLPSCDDARRAAKQPIKV